MGEFIKSIRHEIFYLLISIKAITLLFFCYFYCQHAVSVYGASSEDPIVISSKTDFISKYLAPAKKLINFYTNVQMEGAYTIRKEDGGEIIRGRFVYYASGQKQRVDDFGEENVHDLKSARIATLSKSFQVEIRKGNGRYFLPRGISNDYLYEIEGSRLSSPVITAAFGCLEMTIIDYISQDDVNYMQSDMNNSNGIEVLTVKFQRVLSLKCKAVTQYASFKFLPKKSWVLHAFSIGGNDSFSCGRMSYDTEIKSIPLISFC